MKTLMYNINVRCDTGIFHSSDIPVSKSEINYSSTSIIKDYRSSNLVSKFGWVSDIPNEQTYGSISTSSSMFVTGDSVIPAVSSYLIPMSYYTINIGKRAIIDDMFIYERSGNAISAFIVYSRNNRKDRYSFISNVDDATDDVSDDSYFNISNRSFNLSISTNARNIPVRELLGVAAAVTSQELSSFRSTISMSDLDRFEKVSTSNKIYKTRFFAVSDILFVRVDNGIPVIVEPIKSNPNYGVFYFDSEYDELFCSYTVNPIVSIVDGGINYRRLIDSNSEINIFEIVSPDCFSIEIDNRELNIEIGGGVNHSAPVSINAELSSESIFLEPDDSITVNGDIVLKGGRYELTNYGMNNLSISIPNNKLTTAGMETKTITIKIGTITNEEVSYLTDEIILNATINP